MVKKEPCSEEHMKNLVDWNQSERKFDLRYKYPITTNSIVLDLGAYVGAWSHEIWKRYRCNIYAFEPIYDFYHKAAHTLNNEEIIDASNKKIRVFNYAIGNSDRHENITSIKDGSTFFVDGDKTESVHIRDIVEVLDELGIKDVQLMKMNVEGSEYEILERLVDLNMLSICNHYQIQFHRKVDGYEERRKKIHKELRKTHKCDYNYEFIWESWSRKKG